MNHQAYLNQTLEIAKQSVTNGNHPFGAILVLNDKVVCTSENEVNTLGDITAHAELRLVQKAQKKLSAEELSNCSLYSSTEPCAMCSGAIYWAGIRSVVYGCSTSDLFKIVKEGLYLTTSDVFDKSTSEYSIETINQNQEYINIHKSFWRKK